MPLFLHNTLTRKKQEFIPADVNRITLYVCGPTVYNHAHIGNFRAAVAFDVLFRLLRYYYGEQAVVYARNFTDIEDKIIRAAQENGKEIDEITTKYAKIYNSESAALKILPPTLEPLATEHVAEMQSIISTLLEKNAAYIAEEHVLFDTNQFSNYGALSNLNMDDMIAGARVEIAPYKRNPADFVLWKPSAAGEPGWQPPTKWQLSGNGRPGWHIECSAMIEKTLGTTIDIHAGGQDLRFPHHENEIAQSACAHDAPLSRVWLHNGFLQMGKDKMSKSVGNVALVCDLLEQWPGEVLRWALLSAQYRQPVEWTDALLEQSKTQLDRFYRLFTEQNINIDSQKPDSEFLNALNDDMNTPGAMAVLHGLRDRATRQTGTKKIETLRTLKASGILLGFFDADPEEWFKQKTGTASFNLTDTQIDILIEERVTAKTQKNYARADEIRDQLNADGVIIEDSANGTTWRRK